MWVDSVSLGKFAECANVAHEGRSRASFDVSRNAAGLSRF